MGAKQGCVVMHWCKIKVMMFMHGCKDMGMIQRECLTAKIITGAATVLYTQKNVYSLQQVLYYSQIAQQCIKMQQIVQFCAVLQVAGQGCM